MSLELHVVTCQNKHVVGLAGGAHLVDQRLQLVASIGTDAARRGVRAEGRRAMGDHWAVVEAIL